MSSSSPIAAAFSNSLATFSTIFGFFKVFVGALGLDFEVGPSNERADATSFKEVVRDFNNLGAALELRLESGVLWVVDLRIIVSKCYSKDVTYLSPRVAVLSARVAVFLLFSG